ncbi:MAG: hypothetical protein HY897_17960 [Deltaproteobacteria bacterium]|nr:hypothetical protein [Deltaproteobacteria bacterium]
MRADDGSPIVASRSNDPGAKDIKFENPLFCGVSYIHYSIEGEQPVDEIAAAVAEYLWKNGWLAQKAGAERSGVPDGGGVWRNSTREGPDGFPGKQTTMVSFWENSRKDVLAYTLSQFEFESAKHPSPTSNLC